MFFLAIFSSFLTFSLASPTDRIVGGFPVEISDFGFVGSLRLLTEDGGTQHFCGCTIFTESVIGTAAHCVQGRLASTIRLRFNSTYHEDGGVLVEPQKILIHPEFNSTTFDYDIALMFLSNPLEVKKYPGIRKIPLPYQNERFYDGKLTRVCGWGVTQNPDELRYRLRCADVPIVNQITCQNSFRTRIVTERMICAGEESGGVDACQGDSGGPLLSVEDGTLVGLVSWGILCATRLYPGIYVRVAYFREWIDNEIKNYSPHSSEIPRENNKKNSYQFD